MCPSPFLSCLSACLSLPLSVCPSLMHAHTLLNNMRRAMSWTYLRQLIWDNNSKPFCSFLHLLQIFRLWNKHKIFCPLTIMCTLILNTMSLQHKFNVSPLFIIQSQYIFWIQNTLQFNIQLLCTVISVYFHHEVDTLPLCIQSTFIVNLMLLWHCSHHRTPLWLPDH